MLELARSWGRIVDIHPEADAPVLCGRRWGKDEIPLGCIKFCPWQHSLMLKHYLCRWWLGCSQWECIGGDWGCSLMVSACFLPMARIHWCCCCLGRGQWQMWLGCPSGCFWLSGCMWGKWYWSKCILKHWCPWPCQICCPSCGSVHWQILWLHSMYHQNLSSKLYPPAYVTLESQNAVAKGTCAMMWPIELHFYMNRLTGPVSLVAMLSIG